ncbi:MAG: hypothetical protein HY859_13525 [Caulobacterales bacterium]|nr:hypothetical protein [Caulobacterales bacterium]
MSIPPIVLSDFSWEAFATLVTGALAVGGAVWIHRRQTLILDRQVEIEALKTRIELFDRRMKIVELHSKLLSRSFNEQTRLPHLAAFMDARGSVPFLFDEAVGKLFDKGYEIGVDIDTPGLSGTAETRLAATENRMEFLAATAPYMKLGTLTAP